MAITPEEALHSYLLGQSDLQGIVQGRIRTGRANVGDKRPFIVIEPPQVVSQQHTGGSTAFAESLIPVHCEGTSYAEAREIATKIFDKFKAGFQNLMGTLDVRNVIPLIRGKTPNVVSGDNHKFHAVELHLTIFHEI